MYTFRHPFRLLGMITHVFALALAPEPTEPARLAKSGDVGIKAIVPVSSGQIGISPVESDLGDPSTYIGIIYGVDTQYITLDTATVTTVSTSQVQCHY